MIRIGRSHGSSKRTAATNQRKFPLPNSPGQFFRKYLQIGKSESSIEGAVEKATRLALSPKAENLPGYLGK